MAKQTTVTVTDDLDGSANAKEVTFSLNGESWTIDLSAKNRNALEKALKPYIAKATKQGRRRPAASSRKTAARGPRRDLAQVRLGRATVRRPTSRRPSRTSPHWCGSFLPGEADAERRALLGEAIDAIDDGLAGDAVAGEAGGSQVIPGRG